MMMHTSILLSLQDVGLRFGAQVLFEHLSLASHAGALALTGSNGTGKSSLLALMAGVRQPDQGRVAICGFDLVDSPVQARQQLAYMPDDAPAYPFMTGRAFLEMVDALRGRHDMQQHAPDLLAGFGLLAHLDKRFETMSLGTRKKFMLVAGLMSQAAVQLMDEPSNGIDAEARALLIDLVVQRQQQQLFVFSTHDSELVQHTRAQVLRLGG